MKETVKDLIINDVKQSDEGNNMLTTFLKKHHFVISLIMIIFIIVLWSVFKMKSMEKQSLALRTQLTETYETKLKSENIASMELTATVFSWAIRSELNRQNLENVNHFFSEFIKEPDIRKLQLIDPANGKILISTDKKDEGSFIRDNIILQSDKVFNISDDNEIKIISPVMGLNSRIGILIIEKMIQQK